MSSHAEALDSHTAGVDSHIEGVDSHTEGVEVAGVLPTMLATGDTMRSRFRV